VHSKQRERSENLGDLRSEYWRMNDDIARRTIGDDFTFCKNNASVSNRRNDFNIVSRNHDCMAIGSKLFENGDQPLLGPIVKPSSGFIEQKQRRFRGQNNRERKTEALSL